MDQYGAFPVRRGEVDRKALGKAVAIMREGRVLGISPEGHRSETATLGRAKPGAARMALQTDTPILPVAVSGTESAVSELFRLRRPRMAVRIGEPFRLEAQKPVSKERQQDLADELMLRIAALLPESYRGVYANGKPGPDVEAYTPALTK
jgi:1-acyl-sn-glycerol-3-phosphate acyltransferase